MDIFITIVIILLMVIAALVTWVGIPGTFIMSAVALIYGWATGFEAVTGSHILTMVAISLILEGLEFFLGGLAARLYGASPRSAVFAILGGIVGALIGVSFLILIGAFVGLLVGSYLGAYVSEKLAGKSDAEAARAALGTLVGNVTSKAIKSAAAVIFGIWLIKAVFQ
ncbi:MAG: DUF456 domain-containing protein [Fidelibacterota bacterium]|nr:MAG: DUF456 domain-containing protein [Candidatus Neomarinimicrobiota bacterium]